MSMINFELIFVYNLIKDTDALFAYGYFVCPASFTETNYILNIISLTLSSIK